MKDVLLNVKNLSVKFKTLEGNQTAIEGNSFSVYKGEVFCLVGGVRLRQKPHQPVHHGSGVEAGHRPCG